MSKAGATREPAGEGPRGPRPSLRIDTEAPSPAPARPSPLSPHNRAHIAPEADGHAHRQDQPPPAVSLPHAERVADDSRGSAGFLSAGNGIVRPRVNSLLRRVLQRTDDASTEADDPPNRSNAGGAAAAPKAQDIPLGSLLPVPEAHRASQHDKAPRSSFVTDERIRDIMVKQAAKSRRAAATSPAVLMERLVQRIQSLPMFRDHRLDHQNGSREIDVDLRAQRPQVDQFTGKRYIDNTVTTARYTMFSFLPLQLLAQFSKLANCYFLSIAILQLIPGLSTTGQYTTIVPLLAFISLAIAREGYDDFRRYRQDKAENRQEATRLALDQNADKVECVPCAWKDLAVGDIVEIEAGEWVPVDLLILGCEAEDDLFYVETAALDGESSLKVRLVPKVVAGLIKTRDSVKELRGRLQYETPNRELFRFNGKLRIDDDEGIYFPVMNDNIVYRGSVARSTGRMWGVAIFTGEETKLRMNALKNTRTKAPVIQYTTNKIVVVIVCIVVVLACMCSVAHRVWASNNKDVWYLAGSSISFPLSLVTFIILFNTMVPLSLYVSMEIVKLFQILFLSLDIDLYDPVSNTPCEPRTSSLNEDLGQITHVFSDKTGTLTDNLMIFRKLSISGQSFIHSVDARRADMSKTKAPRMRHFKRMHSSGRTRKAKSPNHNMRRAQTFGHEGHQLALRQGYHTRSPSSTRRDYSDYAQGTTVPASVVEQQEHNAVAMLRYIQEHPHTLFARRARMLLLSMAACHSCWIDTSQNRDSESVSEQDMTDSRSLASAVSAYTDTSPSPEEIGAAEESKVNANFFDEEDEIAYQSASPDEEAILNAARELGIVVMERSSQKVLLRTYPNGFKESPVVEEYKILDIIDFSSKRKRMTVVLRFPDGRIAALTKGADSVITERLRLNTLAMKTASKVALEHEKARAIEASQAAARSSMTLPRASGLVSRPSSSSRKLKSPMHSAIQLDGWLRSRTESSPGSDFASASTNMPRHSLAYGETTLRSPISPVHPGRFSQTSLHSHLGMRDSESGETGEFVLDETLMANDAMVLERTFRQIDAYAIDGLRTLMYGYRIMSEEDYAAWSKLYHEASSRVDDKREEKVEEASEALEKNLELAGAIAVEDRLQHGVPETIDRLRRANIKVWMLTGDKRETAVNIGKSCRLIRDFSRLVFISKSDTDLAGLIVDEIYALRGAIEPIHTVVVIDGETLALVEVDATLMTLFMELSVHVNAVICCRASPSQKAMLVRETRRFLPDAVTLAIGDGANDIAMIQEAHVGIGIAGKEGRQAARSSDYSIGQFRFLSKLLLVHGRWMYNRISKYTLSTFYKEFLFYGMQAIFQGFDAYTGTSLFESWSQSMFNTLFTSLPVIAIGIFEKDLEAATLIAAPELYAFGQQCQGLNVKKLVAWMFLAVSEGFLIQFVAFELFGIRSLPVNDLYSYGTLVYTGVVCVVVLKILFIEWHGWTAVNALAAFISVGGWFLFTILLTVTSKPNGSYIILDNLFEHFGRSTIWWLTLVFLVIAPMIWDALLRAIRQIVMPTEEDLFLSLQRDPLARRRMEEESFMELEQGWAGKGPGTTDDDKNIVELLEQRHDDLERDSTSTSVHALPRGKQAHTSVYPDPAPDSIVLAPLRPGDS